MQIQQRAKFDREETGNGSLSLAARPSTNYIGVTGGESRDEGAFRKQILQLDEAMLQDHGVLCDPMDRQGTNGEETSARKTTQGNSTRERRACGGSGNGHGRTGGRLGEEPIGVEQENDIPFSWIVRGRQERHLIDQQVCRTCVPRGHPCHSEVLRNHLRPYSLSRSCLMHFKPSDAESSQLLLNDRVSHGVG